MPTYKTDARGLHLFMNTRRTLGVGLVGYNFMGRAHSNAWRQAPRFFELPADVRMKTICGRNAAAVREGGGRGSGGKRR